MVRLRNTYETHLVRVKGFRRDRSTPRCYISHLPEEQVLVEQLVADLKDAGIFIIQDPDQMEPGDFVVVADTTLYQRSYKRNTPSIAADIGLIRQRLEQDLKTTVVPPSAFEEFQQQTRYVLGLFDLVMRLYAIPFSMGDFANLRKTLHRQWEQTLAGVDEVEEEHTQQRRLEFLRLLENHFKQNELEDLCFLLNIKFENLGGQTRKDKARELLTYCERHGRLADLQRAVNEERPHIQWPRLYVAPQGLDLPV